MNNGTLYVLANRPNINTDLITGLKANTDYYISVIVEDPDGNKTAYKTLTARTELTGSKEAETAGVIIRSSPMLTLLQPERLASGFSHRFPNRRPRQKPSPSRKS